MNHAAAAFSLCRLPRHFSAKDGRRFRLDLLEAASIGRFVETYLAFQPRNSFQGLPPLRDEICVKWVEEMIRSGVNLIASSLLEGIVGHTAMFPINDRKCELLVVVWPRFQNIGVGTQLTSACVQMACELGFDKMWLPVDSTNQRARHIYVKCGFEYASNKQSRELDMVCDLTRRRADRKVGYAQWH
jgi:RimJ/RimL family protein N-acetyltransferase